MTDLQTALNELLGSPLDGVDHCHIYLDCGHVADCTDPHNCEPGHLPECPVCSE